VYRKIPQFCLSSIPEIKFLRIVKNCSKIHRTKCEDGDTTGNFLIVSKYRRKLKEIEGEWLKPTILQKLWLTRQKNVGRQKKR
jgi:rRNA maturation protein Rpf1